MLFKNICDEIVSKRYEEGNVVTCQIVPRSTFQSNAIPDLLDAFTLSLGFSAIGKRWQQIDKKSTEEYLRLLLHRDLCYGAKSMSWFAARRLSRQFVEYFAPDLLGFSSFKVVKRTLLGMSLVAWHDVGEGRMFTMQNHTRLTTNAITDGGIVCLDANNIGIVCVQDSD